MKTLGQDVFTALYDAFRRLDKIKGPDEPETDAAPQAFDVFKERVSAAQKEVETILDEGAKLLDRYVENRVKKVIAKMKYDGEL